MEALGGVYILFTSVPGVTADSGEGCTAEEVQRPLAKTDLERRTNEDDAESKSPDLCSNVTFLLSR